MKLARSIVLWMIAGVCWWLWIDLTAAGIQSMTDYSDIKSKGVAIMLFIITTLVVTALVGDARNEI